MILRATNRMNVDVPLSTNARDVRPQFGPKLSIDAFLHRGSGMTPPNARPRPERRLSNPSLSNDARFAC